MNQCGGTVNCQNQPPFRVRTIPIRQNRLMIKLTRKLFTMLIEIALVNIYICLNGNIKYI
jgi:hypothetical protein